MVSVEAFFTIDSANDIITYHFDVRRGTSPLVLVKFYLNKYLKNKILLGIYTIESKNNDAILTQRFYVHRRIKNLIVNEIRIELLSRNALTVDLFNLTRLDLDPRYINSPLNPNRYSFYNQEFFPENMTYEQRVIKHPTNLGKRVDANDGI